MGTITENMNERDRQLYKIARKRVEFRNHLVSYIIVNTFLWCIWFFGNDHESHGMVPWPVWSTLGWGVGLAFSYYKAYYGTSINAIDKEYEKLRNREQR